MALPESALRRAAAASDGGTAFGVTTGDIRLVTSRPTCVGIDTGIADHGDEPTPDDPPMPMELARFSRVPVLETHAPVELLRATYVTHRFAPHAHDAFAIGVMEGGAVRTRVGPRSVVVPGGGWILALDPGTVHTGEPMDDAGYRYRMFYIDAPLFRAVLGGDDAASTPVPSFGSPAIFDPVLAGRLARAHALLEDDTDRLLAEEAFVDAMGELVRRHGSQRLVAAETRASAGVVRLVREYIEEEYARVVTLAELSRLTGLSPFHISRVFRSSMGLPPYAYLALVRVQRAQALIRAGHPLSAVTHATGFADQSHFTRRFKRAVGVPPGQYAREIAGSFAEGGSRAPVVASLHHRSARPVTVRPAYPPVRRAGSLR